MLLGIEIHGMHLAFRSAHVNTLANNDDEMKPYLFCLLRPNLCELTLWCVVRCGLLPTFNVAVHSAGGMPPNRSAVPSIIRSAAARDDGQPGVAFFFRHGPRQTNRSG